MLVAVHTTYFDGATINEQLPAGYAYLAEAHRQRDALDGFPVEKATLLHDGPDGQSPQQEPLKLDKKGNITLTLQPQCAAVLF